MRSMPLLGLEPGEPLGDGHGGQIGVRPGHGRDDRGVGDAESVDAQDPAAGVDHPPEWRRTNGVIWRSWRRSLPGAVSRRMVWRLGASSGAASDLISAANVTTKWSG